MKDITEKMKTEQPADFIVYAMVQSRDDRTLDMASSQSDDLLSDVDERVRVRKFIEAHAPSPNKNNFTILTGKNWLAAFLRPDKKKLGQRFRPVLLAVNQVTWKTIDPETLGDAVKTTVGKLVGQDELSSERMQDFLQKLSSSAKAKARPIGCIIAISLAATIIATTVLILIFSN